MARDSSSQSHFCWLPTHHDDLMLLRKIVSVEEEDAETMEAVFAQARDTEARP